MTRNKRDLTEMSNEEVENIETPAEKKPRGRAMKQYFPEGTEIGYVELVRRIVDLTDEIGANQKKAFHLQSELRQGFIILTKKYDELIEKGEPLSEEEMARKFIEFMRSQKQAE